MINEDILRFSEFLDSYKENYAKPSSEISRPHSKNKSQAPLVSSDCIMLDFDAMCRDAKFYPKENWSECNRPSTTDAIYYRIQNPDNLELSLVEFKTFYFTLNQEKYYDMALNKIRKSNLTQESQKGLEMLEKVQKKLGNTVEFSLRIKPYETLFVVLPKLYEEYCRENNISEKDKINLYDFFKSDLCTIKLFIVGKRFHNNLTKAYNTKLGSSLEKQYRRLDFVNVLCQHPQRLCFENEFDYYANQLKSHEQENLKSLNYTTNNNK